MNVQPILNVAKEYAPQIMEFLKELAASYGPKIKERVVEMLKHTAEKKAESFFCNINDSSKKNPNILAIQEEFLTKDKLVQYIKENMIPQADEVATILKKDEKNIYIYTAFLCNGELVHQDENKYIVLVADGISRDIETLFENNKLVVLK